MKDSAQIAIIGAGLGGLAAAAKLTSSNFAVTVYESKPYLGGHSSSHTNQGFTFDEGPHISFTKNKEVQDYLAAHCESGYFEKQAEILNYWNGYWLKHPVQTNLCGLPDDIIQKCISGFRERKQNQVINNYYQWCQANFGSEITSNFFEPYTKKYWTVDCQSMTCDWISSRIHAPTEEEIMLGSQENNQKNFHYITNYRYPKSGGFGAYAGIAPKNAIYLLNTKVIRIGAGACKKWQITSDDSVTRDFDYVISSMPLPSLIKIMADVPAEVSSKAAKLNWTSIMLINLGLKPETKLPDADWLYVYDKDLIFSRIHFPHRLSPNNCPDRQLSLQAEIYFPRDFKPESSELIPETIKQLIEAGIIQDQNDIIFQDQIFVPFGNVIFDHNRLDALQTINSYLDQSGLLRCGRYGNWDYYWTDDTILSAWRVAQKIISSDV